MNKTFTSSVSLAGMLLLISIAYGLDVWMDSLKRIAMAEFKLSTWLILATTMELLLAGILLVWLWFVYFKDSDHLVTALLFVLVGFGVLFYNFVAVVSGSTLPLVYALTPKSFSSLASALVAMVGLQRLLFRKTKF